MTARSQSRWWYDTARIFAIVVVASSMGAVLAWESFGSGSGPSFFYPSAGVVAAAMMLTRRAVWPGIAAAVIVAELLVDTHYDNRLLMSAGYAVSNVVEPLVGASVVLAWCGGRPDLRKRRDFVAFIVGACLTGPFVGGLIGGTVSSIFNDIWWINSAGNWWAGDALGVLVVAAPILLWATQSYIVRQRPWETAGVLIVTAALSISAFWTEAPPSILILPVLAWAALRLDMLGAALAGAVAAFLANIMATRGRGLFSSMDVALSTRVALTQAFIAVIVVVAMLIAQEAAERLSAVRERETERRERMRLQTLSHLAQLLSAAITPHDIGRALENQVVNEAGAQALNLGLVSADRRRLEWVTMAGYPQAVLDAYGAGVEMSDRTVATDVARTGEPVVIRSAAEYAGAYPGNGHWLKLSGAQSVAGYPLTAGGQPVGALLLVWSEPQPLNTAQLAYMSAVATMVGQALVRARIYTDEHARAAVLQSAVLPASPVATAGLDVSVTYEPADVTQGVGGDWYDIMPLPRERTFLAVGDVVGHGLPAVEDMAQLRSAGRALAYQGLLPGRLLAELNGFTRHASLGKFATMAVAVYDPDEAVLWYGSAGHPPPLLRRAADGEVIRLDDAHGPVLGPLVEASYAEGRVPISAGDVLVMYTDGLVERIGMDLDSGMARAERIIAGWDGGALSDYCSALRDHLAPRPRADDVCILAVRFSG